MRLRLVSWNINSVRLRQGLVRRLVEEHRPDVVCLQEIKCETDAFPREAMAELGLPHMAIHGQRGYHGVATLTRLPILGRRELDHNGTGEARHLAVSLRPGRRGAPIEVHNVYVPSGGDIPDPGQNPKFAQKLAYLGGLERWSAGLSGEGEPRHILCGDLNVAPLEHDVWSHRQLLGVVSHTPVEVEHLERAMAAHGWVDVMRRHVPPDQKLYTWWSYRNRDWKVANRGRRLDHVWTSPGLARHAKGLEVVGSARDWQGPSDHVPVIVDFDLPAGG